MINDFKEVTTNNFQETFALGEVFAHDLKGGELICLEGDLGAGKTTFTQGLLYGLGVKETVNSPTFVVMKHYSLAKNINNIENIYHIDTYRVEINDIMDLGWEELIRDKKNVVIVEWPKKIKDIIPEGAIKFNFKCIDENRRSVNLKRY